MSRRMAFYALVALCAAVVFRFDLRAPGASALEILPQEERARPGSGGATPSFHCEAWDDGVHGNELGCWNELTRQRALIMDIRPGRAGSDPYNFTYISGNLYFLADDGRGVSELWRTDGTVEGTLRARDLEMGVVDGLLIF